jgi:hypothetical protein
MSKARDLANAGTALTTVSATELGYLDGVTSAVQTQINAKEATLPSQTGNSGKYLTTDGTAKSWGTVSQYALPSQTGNSGKFLTTNGTSESWGTVTTPITFTQKYTPTTEYAPTQMASNGTNIIVVVGSLGELISSTDSGATFTARTSGFGSNPIYSLAFGGGTFVAVGANGTISSSTDGITWTARTSGVGTNILWSVSYLNGNFVAVGAGAAGGTGGVTTSTDGITWTKRTTPSLTSNTLKSVTFGNGYYVAVGSFNTTAGIYSTNLSTWTALPTTITDPLNMVDYQDYRFLVFIETSNKIWYTGNNPTTGWASLTNTFPWISPQLADLGQHIKAYNNKYYYFSTNINMIPQIYSMSTAISTATNIGFTTDYMPIPIPTRISTSEVVFYTMRAFTMLNNGKFVIAFTRGRIYLQD